MAEIIITIPDEKIDLIVSAVEYHLLRRGELSGEVTPAIASAWIKEQLIKNIKGLVKVYQQEVHEDNFVFDDPMGS